MEEPRSWEVWQTISRPEIDILKEARVMKIRAIASSQLQNRETLPACVISNDAFLTMGGPRASGNETCETCKENPNETDYPLPCCYRLAPGRACASLHHFHLRRYHRQRHNRRWFAKQTLQNTGPGEASGGRPRNLCFALRPGCGVFWQRDLSPQQHLDIH